MTVLLLTGMDGTGRLFAAFVRHLPHALEPRVVMLPASGPQDYDTLLAAIDLDLGSRPDPVALIAESFSGPVAIRLARLHPDRVSALILVASFTQSPSPLARWTPAMLAERIFGARIPDLAPMPFT